MALVDLSNGSLLTDATPPSAQLEPDADTAGLEEVAKVNGPIAIHFPAFTDGRGFSLARLLRERHGFTGELRAVGNLIPDQAFFLFRSGFDTAEIDRPEEIGTWKKSLRLVTHAYQSSSRNPAALRNESGAKRAEDLAARLAATDDLEERIAIVAEHIPGRIAFSTSLGLEDQAILDAIAGADADIDIFTLDTGRLFPEVLETLELSEIRYRRTIRTVAPEAKEVEELVARDGVFGFRRSVENRKNCCEIRKVRPLNKALSGAAGWITGIRREQAASRAAMALAEWDEDHRLIKINPLADWSAAELDDYIAARNVPVNPLHKLGFISIGCQPCTRAVAKGEDPRAGRWWWENEEKKECGLHMNPLRKVREGQAA